MTTRIDDIATEPPEPPAAAHPDGAPREPAPRVSGTGVLVTGLATVLVILALVATIVVVVVATGGGGGADPATRTITIPAGTGARLAAGEVVELIPAQYFLNAGDTMVIDNFDTQSQQVGPFTVKAGEHLSYVFRDPGRFVGACSIHPSGEVTFVVR